MRAIWSGTISFGLVTIPVQLFPATRGKEISFHLLHEPDHSRIKYQKICAQENKEVPDSEITKAFEYQKGRYVVLSDEELAAVDPRVTRAIDILDFVDAGEIDPIQFKKAYYLGAVAGGEKAYSLLAKTLANTGRLAIGQCVIRSKQYLVAIRSTGRELLLETMFYPDEIVDAGAVNEGLEETKVTAKELELAESLVEKMAAKFDPAKYKDTYREKILEIVERKAAGETITAPKAPPPAPVIDLVAALKSSLGEAKKAG